MTHAEIWSGIPAIYAQRIMELEKQLGECSGALQFTEKQLAMLRDTAWTQLNSPFPTVRIGCDSWLAIMGELP